MTGFAADVVQEALSHLGEGEHPPGSNRTTYGASYGLDGQPWCDMFLTKCFELAAVAGEHFASTVADVADGRRRGTFTEGREGGRPGDKVFFHWPGSSRGQSQPDHVELVVALADGGGYVTVGGNVGDQVRKSVRRANILGFKHPAYATVQGQPPAAPPPPPPSLHPYPGHYLRRGSRGMEVIYLQSVVGTEHDGIFGPRTEAAVRVWQRAHGLHVDGVVGPLTWATFP